MNYRHAFHAGNFADVFKHAMLSRILAYLMRKDAPLRYLDTHAGVGRYDLSGDEASRTGEWREGIARVVNAQKPADVAALLAPWLEVVGACDAEGKPQTYPGSPALAQAMLRPQDRLTLCELHPADSETLRRAMGRDLRVKALHIDGYMALNAYVPPVERRGLVLVDPPFEIRRRVRPAGARLRERLREMADGGLRALASGQGRARGRSLLSRAGRLRRGQDPAARTGRGRAGRRRPARGQRAGGHQSAVRPCARRRARCCPGSPGRWRKARRRARARASRPWANERCA